MNLDRSTTCTNQSVSRADEPELPRIREVLQELYHQVDNLIAQHHPVCQLSGRCCRFHEWDHVLYLTRIEARLLIGDAPKPVHPLAIDGSTCPWQDQKGRCTARNARPLACRLYFCDPTYQDSMPDVSQEAIQLLQHIFVQAQWDWDYAPLHVHLTSLWQDASAEMPPGQRIDPQQGWADSNN